MGAPRGNRNAAGKHNMTGEWRKSISSISLMGSKYTAAMVSTFFERNPVVHLGLRFGAYLNSHHGGFLLCQKKAA